MFIFVGKMPTYSLVPLAMNAVSLLDRCFRGCGQQILLNSFETVVEAKPHAVTRELKVQVNEVKIYIQMVMETYSNVKSTETKA